MCNYRNYIWTCDCVTRVYDRCEWWDEETQCCGSGEADVWLENRRLIVKCKRCIGWVPQEIRKGEVEIKDKKWRGKEGYVRMNRLI